MRFRVEVVNLRNCANRAEVCCCDRRTSLGNPHEMRDQSDEERNRVCDAFARDFCPNPEQLAYLRDIWREGVKHGVVHLGCHCHPARCHTETIRDWLESHMDDNVWRNDDPGPS